MPHKIIFSDQAAEKLILIFNDIETRFGKRSKDLVKKEFQKTIISASIFPEIGKIYEKTFEVCNCKKKVYSVLSF
jgi:plasmid stabilization system protein ParE